MAVYRPELFGPVGTAFMADSENGAVCPDNDVPFSLGTPLHTNDPEKAVRVANRIEAGMV